LQVSALRRRMVFGTVAAAAAPFVRAQGSAAGSVRLLVPFTPGTGIDLIAREIAPALSARFKRPFVVENRAGASGNIGTQDVARATADGTTLLVSVNTLVMNRALYPRLGFDPLKDLDPVSLTSWGQLILAASPHSGIDSLSTFMARAKAKPGALNYGSPGAGTPHHLAMELLKNRAKVSLTHISYRGTAPALTELLGAPEVEMLHGALRQILALRDALRLRVALDHDRTHAPLPELDRQAHAHWAAPHDRHFGVEPLSGLFLCLYGLPHSAVIPCALIKSAQRLASAAISRPNSSGVL
jgi:tripartite-type tricarboxylate transporter receptor subunit TctC